MKKLLYIGLSILMTFTLCAAADNAPVAECQNILAMSDSTFNNTIQKDSQGAIASVLLDCEKINACQQMNGVDNCNAELFNRGFVADLTFNSFSANTPAPSNSANVSTPSDSPSNATNTENNNNNSSADNTAPTNNTNEGPQTKNNPSINWF